MNARDTVRGLAALALVLGLGADALAGQERMTQQGERMTRPGTGDAPDYDENWQARKLPPLPRGMTVAMLREGDSLFRSAGGCITCHGQDGQGVPAQGSAITAGLQYIPAEWDAIDSLITAGIPEPVTRVPVAMPPRGAGSDLQPEQIRRIAAYVWAISQVQGEPWEGGHRTHAPQAAIGGDAAARRTANR